MVPWKCQVSRPLRTTGCVQGKHLPDQVPRVACSLRLEVPVRAEKKSDREIHAPPPQNRRSASRVQNWGWCVICPFLRFRQFVKVARLQCELCTKDSFELRIFLRKMSRSFPEIFEPLFCGSEKSCKIATKFPTKFSKFPGEKSKKIHRRASAGAQGEQFAHHPPTIPPDEEGLLWEWCVVGGPPKKSRKTLQRQFSSGWASSAFLMLGVSRIFSRWTTFLT